MRTDSISIGVNCFGLKPGAGGVGVYCRDVVNSLLKLENAPSIVAYYGKNNSKELERLLPGVQESKGCQIDDWNKLVQSISSRDVYFAPLNGYYPFPVPVPTAVTLHDNQERFFPDMFDDQQLRQRRRLQRGAALCSDIVITVSHFSARCLSLGYGLAPEKVRVCPHFAHPLAEPMRPAHALPSEFLFYPANRWRHKNHETLIEAVSILRACYRLEVPVVCSGYRLRSGIDLDRMARDFGVADLIHDVGFVSDEEVAWLYRHAKALVFPSLYEGFGYPVLEAMSADCPVLAARAGSLPEVAGSAALYFSPTNAEEMASVIKTVWTNRDLRSVLADRGRARVKEFSQKRFTEEHLAAFRHTVELYSTQYYRRRNVRQYLIQKHIWRVREFLQGVRFERPAKLPDLSNTKEIDDHNLK